MNQDITFKIDNNQRIIIQNLCYQANHMCRYDPIEIFFQDKDKKYLISQHDYLMPQVEAFYYYLKDAIEGKLDLLPQSENLGYSWNKKLHNTVIKTDEEFGQENYWKGTKYLMWSGNVFDTWLYNKNVSIFMEIKPGYKWHFQEPEEGEDFVSYEDWIKEYEPIKLVEIDSNIASIWLQKLEALMKEIKSNDSKYLHKEQGPSD